MLNLIDDVLGYGVGKEIEWYRQELHIRILGAYRPESAKKRLENLRNRLIERGYGNTYIVADYPDNNKSSEDWNIYWERKSNELMLHSDLNLFVFFANCSNEGITDELAHFCSEIRKFSGCYVICEDGYVGNISTRIRAKVVRCTLANTVVEDGNDAELCDAAYAFAEMMIVRRAKNL
uniref:Nucleoside 2-deoxyribosyltransferase n=1 Tax=Candidatus Methanogaster sp. ANME-2c ERB4 TaxID=2759911 RepID=A0A7G9YLP6_9EURY|nr:hypothetical protein JAJEHNPH_00023 [Methanosarcinales archaeon ANME-2c ERB4]QNO48930.1 hypothetical protein OEPDFBKK_00005 [Methanosarcinales archaeon ANME-2c ERB4]